MGDLGSGRFGVVVGTDGNYAHCSIDRDALARLRVDDDIGHTSVGAIARIMVRDTPGFCSLTSLRGQSGNDPNPVGELEYIGEGTIGAGGQLAHFRRGVTHYPHPGDPVGFASEADLATIFAPPDVPHIKVGTVFPTESVQAPVLFDQLLGRHFAVVGSSGAGK